MKSARNQRGATLVVAMMLLILMGLMAANAFKSSSIGLRIVGNMQGRQESIAAAQKAVEQTISSAAFTLSPETVAATPVNVDIDGDGASDYTAALTPQPNCYRTRAIKTIELNPDKDGDLSCMQSGGVINGGLDDSSAATTAGNSMCATMEWNVGSRVADARTGADVTVNQGIAVRVLATDAENQCL